MNLKKKFFTFLIILYFFFSNSYAETNTFYIDLDRLIKESVLGKKILFDLEETKKKNLSDLTIKKDDLLKKENDLKKKKNLISTADFEKEFKLLEKEIKLYNQNLSKINSEFDINKNQALNNFFLTVSPKIQEFMTKNNINILLQKKNIFIGKSEYDITERILKIIDKNITTE